MLLSRRGFLQTLSAAMVGAAVFDPKALLWVPAPAESSIVLADAAPGVIATQLELNDLAQRFAKLMGERLAGSRSKRDSVALRQVMYQHVGHVHLPKASLTVDDMGAGQFAATRTRIVRGEVYGAAGMLMQQTEPFLKQMAYALASDISAQSVDMFAPIGPELRPNEPFSDLAVGIGTDPETGLSARVLRYRQPGVGIMTDVEMVGGTWHTARRRKTQCPSCQEDGHPLGDGAYFCADCNQEWRG